MKTRMDEPPPEHWDEVYRTKAIDQVSWFETTAKASLEALARSGAPTTAALIDVGGGASSLVDDLLARGWRDLSVMDLSAKALEAAKVRGGPAADRVAWIVHDVTTWRPPRVFDVWHDRAVFHFLVSEASRSAYRAVASKALASGGLLIIGTFAPGGPTQCSGLPVQRYAVADLEREFDRAFELVDGFLNDHSTPGGAVQPFTWVILRRR